MRMECELATFYDWSEPVAKKRHACCECNAPILKGEKHFKAWGVWSYGNATYRQHLACMEACMMLRDDFNGGECIGFGCLKEAFDELKCEEWDRETDRHKEKWQKLRHLMAAILVRERRFKK